LNGLQIVHSIPLVNVLGDRLENLRVYGVDSMPSASSPPNLDAASSSLCYSRDAAATEGEVIKAICGNNVKARYIVVQLMSYTQLQLCEVIIHELKGKSSTLYSMSNNSLFQ
jgi:hypothetical protein